MIYLTRIPVLNNAFGYPGFRIFHVCVCILQINQMKKKFFFHGTRKYDDQFLHHPPSQPCRPFLLYEIDCNMKSTIYDRSFAFHSAYIYIFHWVN